MRKVDKGRKGILSRTGMSRGTEVGKCGHMQGAWKWLGWLGPGMPAWGLELRAETVGKG